MQAAASSEGAVSIRQIHGCRLVGNAGVALEDYILRIGRRSGRGVTLKESVEVIVKVAVVESRLSRKLTPGCHVLLTSNLKLIFVHRTSSRTRHHTTDTTCTRHVRGTHVENMASPPVDRLQQW